MEKTCQTRLKGAAMSIVSLMITGTFPKIHLLKITTKHEKAHSPGGLYSI
jgi:hypothetical protein